MPARSEHFPSTNLLLDQGAIRITQSVWHGKIQTVKSLKGNRLCEISPQLVEHCGSTSACGDQTNSAYFSRRKTVRPGITDIVRKRKLYPLLEKLGIPRCGFHAFQARQRNGDGSGAVCRWRYSPDSTGPFRRTHNNADTRTSFLRTGSDSLHDFGDLLCSSETPVNWQPEMT